MSKEYPGRYLAIVKNKVVAASRSIIEAYKLAKEAYPEERISLVYMPTEEETVTLL
ncbi:MAG: DUF5678 domain-containing protein [Methanocellales archaeon]